MFGNATSAWRCFVSALVAALGYGEEEEGFGDMEAAAAFVLQVILHLVRSLDACK